MNKQIVLSQKNRLPCQADRFRSSGNWTMYKLYFESKHTKKLRDVLWKTALNIHFGQRKTLLITQNQKITHSAASDS